VKEIIAADLDLAGITQYVQARDLGSKVRCERCDAQNPEDIERLMSQGADVVIDLLPTRLLPVVAEAAVRHGVHYVNASYAAPIRHLAAEAKRRGLTLLPEFGMDPGIDLVLLGEAVRQFDTVEDITTYGAGFPEPKAANNPIQYKVTWTFEGVLKSYFRAGRIIRDGQVVEIRENEMFCPENLHYVELEGIGRLEAFPNGDALVYAELLGLNTSHMRNMGRYVLRWPGHAEFWKKLVDLHLLDGEPVTVDGVTVDRRRFLAAIMEPHLQYRDDERDIAVIRVEVVGLKAGKRHRALYQVIDWRDLTTGFTAMSRTVGFTISIGAQMIGSGELAARGLLSPVKDVPYEPFVRELRKRGIAVTSEFKECH
ncbi:MAG: saccharopine dehydrogenase NADP-binding domain-containing protein, partial [candidate division KSB1 bacterium]|nr:saccharopine dehydrogenase NADP-binding domain-containing protein [candidate division KSB1 bacterium]